MTPDERTALVEWMREHGVMEYREGNTHIVLGTARYQPPVALAPAQRAANIARNGKRKSVTDEQVLFLATEGLPEGDE